MHFPLWHKSTLFFTNYFYVEGKMPYIAVDKNTGKRIDILAIKDPRLNLKDSECLCQLCGEKMFIKAGPLIRPHFAHYADCKSDYKIDHAETPQHLFAKMKLKQILKEQFSKLEHVEIDYEVAIPDIHRVADILVIFPMGWKMAHEIQLSNISIKELEERTNDYLKSGIDVYWWLGKSADNISNRSWCIEKFGFSLSIGFTDNEQTEPFSFAQIS
jgi:competence protein CoiA